MASEPEPDCLFCPRLADFRRVNKAGHPDWFNAPVPSFGSPDASLLIVGLAPGLRGANRTGRPFTGDYAGVLLYETLVDFGFASGTYDERADDGLSLRACRITNTVRCVPPENKPTPAEAAACRGFLAATIREMPNLRAILALGRIAFDGTLRALDIKPSQYKFAHGSALDLHGGRKLFGSYHCSRYNTNTGRLTAEMFRDIFGKIAAYLESAAKEQSQGNAGSYHR
ncbi:uracil-DNA glycosylase [Rhodomicrobium lacus]|uniref:uracil-DNA glycosylase n=1 Tax=Rhodomicrobium lacus TaxID=2498452 RepID=UPI0026E45A6C|nr:uracil-DNA glycosylase [Rhodomicrobium lacus]WKW50379.1 uracil-DNA glycosylase [Rhodomicrobium lacus]